MVLAHVAEREPCDLHGLAHVNSKNNNDNDNDNDNNNNNNNNNNNIVKTV